MQHKHSYGGGKYRRRGCETLPPDSEDQKQKSTVCMPTPDTLPWGNVTTVYAVNVYVCFRSSVC